MNTYLREALTTLLVLLQWAMREPQNAGRATVQTLTLFYIRSNQEKSIEPLYFFATPALMRLNPVLIHEVEKDIKNFLKQQDELLFNEFDFQIQLAIYLRMTGKYDDVEAEYFMPTKNTRILEGYDWDSNMRIDLVVRRGEEYVPIELKYVTKKVVRDFERFGVLVRDMEVLKNQAAQDIRRYDFWKDVRRIELVKNIFPAVKNGLAVFLTNDASYLKEPKVDSVCAPFSMSGTKEIGGGKINWHGIPSVAKDHKPFRLEGKYRVQWESTVIDDIKFDYTNLKI